LDSTPQVMERILCKMGTTMSWIIANSYLHMLHNLRIINIYDWGINDIYRWDRIIERSCYDAGLAEYLERQYYEHI